MSLAKYYIEEQTGDRVVIADLDAGRSVTNDAEAVVRELHLGGLGKRRLFYYDSFGVLDEILHDGKGNWLGFKPGPRE
jgi:hypothetical protein